MSLAIQSDELKLPPDYVSDQLAAEFRAVAMELAKREIEGLRLYEPMPMQNKFHASRTRMRLSLGSNRGGKSLCCAVEIARAVTGQDPFGKFPKKDGRYFCVAKSLKHLGLVMWPLLGKPGAFKVIWDEETRQWRAYRPWDKKDYARRVEAKRAPPLIPERLIEDVGWFSKKLGQPSFAKFRTGSEISFYSGDGRPPMGAPIDGFWLDEEIENAAWFPEMMARIVDRHGFGIWSATPEAGTEHLYDLHEKAEQQRNELEPTVEEFTMVMADNPHITEEDRVYIGEMLDERSYGVKVKGEFAINHSKVYPEFANAHLVEAFQVPPTWSRYAAIDPGHQVCAVLFGAVPPPGERDLEGHEIGETLFLYDELYVKECNAEMFGAEMEKKCANQSFQAFVIDAHMGIHTEVGFGKTVQRQYSDALKKYNVKSEQTGFDFHYGYDDVKAGVLAVHDMLRIREGGPKLRVLETLSNFIWEIKRYRNKVDKDMRPLDVPNPRQSSHLMDCLRYLVCMNPVYVKPVARKASKGGAYAVYMERQRKRRQEAGGSYVRLGPPQADK